MDNNMADTPHTGHSRHLQQCNALLEQLIVDLQKQFKAERSGPNETERSRLFSAIL